MVAREGVTVSVRPEEPGDLAAVRRINERAFGQQDEARIVDKIRQRCDEILSLVAVREEALVGHMLFSPVTIEQDGRVTRGMALGPMAVLPEHQRQGIGSAMVEAGLASLREREIPYVIVLGHPEYYPRFGFEPASRHGIRCQWEGIPDEAFMVLIVDKAVMGGVTGVARYRKEFEEGT